MIVQIGLILVSTKSNSIKANRYGGDSVLDHHSSISNGLRDYR